MPKKVDIIEIFLSSPSDVQEERELLETLIDEINQTLRSTLGLIFELIKWETNVRPSFGDDPQSIINEQIGDSYDVFLGLLWSRFGTPTPRAASGTIEEFQRALARRARTKNAPEIMIYFKDAALPPSKVDAEQLKQIQSFKKSIPQMGGLYSEFSDQTGFESSLCSNLFTMPGKQSLL